MQINERHEFASNDAIVTTHFFWRTSMARWMAVGTRDGVSHFFKPEPLSVESGQARACKNCPRA